MKFIWFGAAIIIILTVFFPMFIGSYQPIIINGPISDHNNLQMINNDSIQVPVGHHVFPFNHNISRNNAQIKFISEKSNSANSTHNLTFNETGLPQGDIWYVNLSGNHSSGPIYSSIYTFHLTNNSYSYCIGTPMKIYHAKGGNVNISKGNYTEKVDFYPFVYQVNLTETGLSTLGIWCVDFNGNNYTAFGSIEFNETNGTYHFTVYNWTCYNAEQWNGVIVVDGRSVNQTITFMGFTILKGIITPANAVLTVNGTVEKLNESGTFCLRLQPGRYNITISASGYNTMTFYETNMSAGVHIIQIDLASNMSQLISKIKFVAVIVAPGFLIIGAAFFFRKKQKK